MDHRSTILILRIVACIVIAAAIGAFIAMLRSVGDLTVFAILTPFAVFMFGVGIGSILFGIAALLQHGLKPQELAPADLPQNQLVDLAMKVEDLGASIGRLNRSPDISPNGGSPGEQPGNTPEVLAALQQLFEELRELSLLPDEQRQKRWQALQASRRELAIKSASELVRDRQWNNAEKAIAVIEIASPQDPAIGVLRKELVDARSAAEAEAIQLTESQIESEMSLSHWEQAAALAQKLAGDFPASERAGKLLNRVQREKGIYTDATVQRLYEEIRHDVERRIWRRALMHARRLLETFPDHPRSELIRKQIKTIQDNAEIEERQEQEMRIGELIRARRFRESVQLAEALLNEFPASPQAEAIQKLLPRIRQLATEEEGKTRASTPV